LAFLLLFPTKIDSDLLLNDKMYCLLQKHPGAKQ